MRRRRRGWRRAGCWRARWPWSETSSAKGELVPCRRAHRALDDRGDRRPAAARCTASGRAGTARCGTRPRDARAPSRHSSSPMNSGAGTNAAGRAASGLEAPVGPLHRRRARRRQRACGRRRRGPSSSAPASERQKGGKSVSISSTSLASAARTLRSSPSAPQSRPASPRAWRSRGRGAVGGDPGVGRRRRGAEPHVTSSTACRRSISARAASSCAVSATHLAVEHVELLVIGLEGRAVAPSAASAPLNGQPLVGAAVERRLRLLLAERGLA